MTGGVDTGIEGVLWGEVEARRVTWIRRGFPRGYSGETEGHAGLFYES